MAIFPGLPRWAGTRKVKPIWILLKQETVSSSGIWAICKSASRSRQITTPVPHHSVFLQAGCPSCRPTNSIKALKAKPLNTVHYIKREVTEGWGQVTDLIQCFDFASVFRRYSWVTKGVHICDPFSVLTLLVGRQEGQPACRNWVVGCWHGCLSGVRCKLAYGPADATATHCLLLQYNPHWFYFSGTGWPG